MLLLALIEGVFLLRLRQENQVLLELSSHLEPMRLELTRAAEDGVRREGELHALKEELGRLHDELERSKTTLNALALSKPKEAAQSKIEQEVFPLGLTTNDVDIAGMVVRGTNTIGTLFLPLRGRCLERAREIRDQHHPLVFGLLISYDEPAVWTYRDGTKAGFAVRFSSAAEAEAVAARMRGLGEGIRTTN